MFYNIDYHVTDRCNRRCVSCGHFSPLVPINVKNKSLETVEEDFKALARFPGLMSKLTITGGECTIHPQLREIVYLALQYFPNTSIRIVSNGVLAERLIALKDILEANERLEIVLTDYIHDNTLRIFEELGPTGRIFRYDVKELGDSSMHERTMFNRGFICEEACTTLEQAQKCHNSAGECIQLAGKKLYACQYLAYYHYFQDYFKNKIKVVTYGDEGIELDKCNTNEEVEGFIRNWIQNICLHCLEPLKTEGKYANRQPLGDTKYELSEWYVKNVDETNQLNNKSQDNENN